MLVRVYACQNATLLNGCRTTGGKPRNYHEILLSQRNFVPTSQTGHTCIEVVPASKMDKQRLASFLFVSTVVPTESDSDVMFCLQSYHGLIIDRSRVYLSYPEDRINTHVIYRFESDQVECTSYLLLGNCKNTITSLSLLVGTTVAPQFLCIWLRKRELVVLFNVLLIFCVYIYLCLSLPLGIMFGLALKRDRPRETNLTNPNVCISPEFG